MRLIGIVLLLSGGTLIFFVLRATAAPSPLVSAPSSGSGSSSGSSGPSGGTRLFNVPIIGPDGGAGTIQVVAHDPASAVINASQGGNTPTGPAVAV
jgi:hypothetical protein